MFVVGLFARPSPKRQPSEVGSNDDKSPFRFGQNAKVVHFLGKTKPWSHTYDPRSKRISGVASEAAAHPSFLLGWWELYSSAVVPELQEQFGDQPFHSGCVEVTQRPASFRRTSSMILVKLLRSLLDGSRDPRRNRRRPHTALAALTRRFLKLKFTITSLYIDHVEQRV